MQLLSTAATDRPRFDGRAILIVDDNASNRFMAQKQLEALGCDVTICEDGESGIEVANKMAFDVILMDIGLPGINGKDAMRRIRDGGGRNRYTPMAAFTAYGYEESVSGILEAGADTILTKPIASIDIFVQALGPFMQTRPSYHARADSSGHAIAPDRAATLRMILGAADFATLLKRFRKDITGIATAIDVPYPDAATLRANSHACISIAGTFGVDDARVAAERLGHAVRHESQMAWTVRTGELRDALRRVLVSIDHHLEIADDGA